MSETPEEEPRGEHGPDLRDRVRAVAQPWIDSIEGRLRHQIDSRVDDTLDERIERAVAARLAVIERALADLDRAVRELASGDPKP
ncbi:MAG TPA: hypothetical protein VGS61_01980 [Acidimicrobiales bacterium]|nr:hypothetical protein [Acidimicrobiales bacterium]